MMIFALLIDGTPNITNAKCLEELVFTPTLKQVFLKYMSGMMLVL